MAKNYYRILGVGSDATQEELRRAYRAKVLQFHPDVHGADTQPFLDVQQAYEALGDPGRRRSYDRSQGPSQQVHVGSRFSPTPVRGRRAPVEPLDESEARPLPDISLARSFQTFHPSFEEIFDRLWGNFTGPARPKAERAEGITLEVPVSYDDAAAGGEARILVPAWRACPSCGGRGGVGFLECIRCSGAGRVSGEFPVLVAFPPGMPDGFTMSVSLDRLGIQNLYLIVRFRVV